MSDHMKPMTWLVGAGVMALDYAKVLQGLKIPFEVIGRGEASARAFKEKTGVSVHQGGLTEFLKQGRSSVQSAIVAVSVDQLASTSRQLMEAGVRRLLVEKPAGLTFSEVRELEAEARKRGAEIYVAYNRRFYSSVRDARTMIEQDGGVTSFQFEFTEWSHVIEKLPDEALKKNWFFANSTHVVDMAFFLGGAPQNLEAQVRGGTSWHPAGSVFAGCGSTRDGALFSYSANWEAPGRWGVEVLTRKRRFIFRPLEKLQIQMLGSVAIQEHALDDHLDKEYKPGLFLQTETFLKELTGLLPLSVHVENLRVYEKILNGSKGV